jgi:hypothetical protein
MKNKTAETTLNSFKAIIKRKISWFLPFCIVEHLFLQQNITTKVVMIKNMMTKNPDTDTPIIIALYFFLNQTQNIKYFMKMNEHGKRLK